MSNKPDLTKFDSYDPVSRTLKARPLTQVQAGAYPALSTVFLALESQADTEDQPHRFEVGLTAEQAIRLAEMLLDSASDLS